MAGCVAADGRPLLAPARRLWKDAVVLVKDIGMQPREFEIIVYGASGYTGKLVAEYLAARHGPGLRWALAGRSLQRLQQARSACGVADSVPLLVADGSEAEALARLAARTQVVLTTVGPYQLYGEALLAACAAGGTDYVDLCGEPAWMYDTVRRYDAAARASGARIVHSCGFDSIPFDLGVYFLQRAAMCRSGGPIQRVRGRVRSMKGGFSGGTAASFAQTLARAQREPEVIGWLRDPFSLVPGFRGPPQPDGSKPLYEPDLGSWAAPFIMATINTKNVHRSNALLGHRYGRDFQYDEMLLTGPGEHGETLAKKLASDRSLLEQAPPPGEGPSRAERESGHYELLFTGTLADGQRLDALVGGHLDPGYGSTSRMIAEAALALARDLPREALAGGVLTPAAALGEVGIARLIEHAGLYFRVCN